MFYWKNLRKFLSILKKEIKTKFVKYEKMFADEILFGGYLTPKLFIKLDLKTKKLARKNFNKINTSENRSNKNTFEKTVIKEYDIYNELLESNGYEIVKKNIV